jgi:ubiquinone/menaquinone biosynthesis C-methylase UbiE
MYSLSAKVYDAIYRTQGKDYAVEAQKICILIQKYKKSKGRTLLEIACGTGNHIDYLKENFKCEGLDNSKEMIEIAQKKFPAIPFHLADMVDFEIGRSFDVITCLFSAIGYVETFPRLALTLKTIAKHLMPGGVAIIEPWFGPGVLDTGKVHAVFVDEPELKIARMNINRVDKNISYLDFNYLVATPQGINNFKETHSLGIFTDDEYQQVFRSAGLKVLHDPDGLDGRGLYIGIKQLN